MFKKKSDDKSKNNKDADLIELGKKLQAFYDSGYVNKKQALLFAFLKGIAAGFGAFIGGTIVVALVLWILSQARVLPFSDDIRRTLDTSTKQDR